MINIEILFLLVWLAFLLVFFIGLLTSVRLSKISTELFSYLKKNKPKRFKEFNRFRLWRKPSDTFLQFKFFRYVNSNLDDENKPILHYKKKLRPLIKRFLMAFLGMFILWLIGVVIRFLGVLL